MCSLITQIFSLGQSTLLVKLKKSMTQMTQINHLKKIEKSEKFNKGYLKQIQIEYRFLLMTVLNKGCNLDVRLVSLPEIIAILIYLFLIKLILTESTRYSRKESKINKDLELIAQYISLNPYVFNLPKHFLFIIPPFYIYMYINFL